MASRYNPWQVFENPEQYHDFFTLDTDNDFEGQHFDRKEVPRTSSSGYVKDGEVKEFKLEKIGPVVSGFANQNKEGGLLVLGISSAGKIVGMEHLNESQINSIADFSYLVNHNAQFKIHEISQNGSIKKIGLILSGYVEKAICHITGNSKKAYKRSALQNIELSEIELESIKRDKGVVNYERTLCVPFDIQDLDTAVYSEYTSTHLDNSTYEQSEGTVLKGMGALTKAKDDRLWFTNSGDLFFAVNPQKDIPQAFIRLLRFDCLYSEHANRSSPNYDKTFTGSITKQIRDFRAFISDSAFFDIYQRRNLAGGFIEEPELPKITVDEAVVNAVAHRDYAISRPILCEKYIDAFVVISPGGIVQNITVPERFSLENTHLEHHSRNPQLMGWLRSMKDANGRVFVQALQEGTKRMRDEMAMLGLLAPEYVNSPLETRVVLYNNSTVRKKPAFVEASDAPEFSNLYPLIGVPPEQDRMKRDHQRKEIMQAFINKLSASGWFIDRRSFGQITAHARGALLPAPTAVSSVVQLFPAYIFQIREFYGRLCLLVDYTVEVQTVWQLSKLLNYLPKDSLLNIRCICRTQGWSRGKITSIDEGYCTVYLFETQSEERLSVQKVIPKLPALLIGQLLSALGVYYDLPKEVKRASFMTDKNASRIRAEATKNVIGDIFTNVFPLQLGSIAVSVSIDPIRLSPKGDGSSLLKIDALNEPQVEFSKHRASPDVREGITQFGSYDNRARDIELIPVCSFSFREAMENLIERLRIGKFKYKGSERTFGAKFTYNTVVTSTTEDTQKEVIRLLDQHSDWKGDSKLSRIFLVHCPETGRSTDDESSPYYHIKRLLLESGIPCQMIDTPTLQNPDFKDLNLALNIVAKCGQTPWVLPESIPECDFFVGLSYTQNYRKGSNRLMAFANVFNQYGRWEFYSGGSEVFDFEKRTKHYEDLVKSTLSKLKLPEEPTICFHYSAKFSKDDKAAILQAARSIRPNGTYVFVWINSHHHLRFYDDRAETNGSIKRGRYVKTSENQIFLSTTGDNPYRRALGTPKPLELNAYIESKNNLVRKPDLRVLASQILSLTKLNWASTDSHCAEPITTKYAGDIAYLTSAFMRQGGDFKLHPVLERTPWFL
jgi:predicted HTH transcriptional regulator